MRGKDKNRIRDKNSIFNIEGEKEKLFKGRVMKRDEDEERVY